MNQEHFETAPNIAYRIISQKILDGEFPPGMKLSRRKMAEITGMSVIPVIEALKRLEEDGLVESKPQWGSFVTVPTRSRVMQCFQLREAIECQTARIVAGKLTPEQLEQLSAMANELDTVSYVSTSEQGSRDTHIAFHSYLARCTGNEMLVRTLDRINLFWMLCKALEVRASKTQYPRYWHRKLLDALQQEDPDAAEATMREHVLDAVDPILSSLEARQADGSSLPSLQ